VSDMPEHDVYCLCQEHPVNECEHCICDRLAAARMEGTITGYTLDVDDEVGAIYISVSETSVAETIIVNDHINLDLDRHGNVSGIEILTEAPHIFPAIVSDNEEREGGAS